MSGGGQFPRGNHAVLLTIRGLDKLGLAVDRIHDRWFDVEAIAYAPDVRQLRIPFWSRPTRRPPIDRVSGLPQPFDDLLVIHDANEPAIEDREHIGIYGFNDIVVNTDRLTIRAEPNLKISCAIRSLHITLGDDTNEAS